MTEIRKADSNDIPLIRELALAVWPHTYKDILSPGQLSYMLNLIYNPDALKDQVTEKLHRFVLLYKDESAVGFASYSEKSAATSSIFRLHKLYLLPSEQGKGSGTKLLDYIVEDIKQDGAAILELNVNRNNPALHFYERSGFTISREEDIDIGNGYFMNDYVMEKRLL